MDGAAVMLIGLLGFGDVLPYILVVEGLGSALDRTYVVKSGRRGLVWSERPSFTWKEEKK
ncbi:hypothetical protein TSUD_175910 [Trifolium subterraneum]|uniref:Uncharacterized protein n=1 Tax=Trifolium subterraneum TaxID=3900 RepID=A0A2Z6LKF0_TRISU|nr:hypothetical protein TSUD_175910 [Trifolium subterraneum]